jgi:hypothetical protein
MTWRLPTTRSGKAWRCSKPPSPGLSWPRPCSCTAGSRSRSGNGDGRVLIERALALFEEFDATGWIAEARAAL